MKNTIIHYRNYFALLLLLLGSLLSSQTAILDTGGPLMPEQAAYDVTHYDLQLEILPDIKAIDGGLTVTATIVHPTDVLVLDLDTLLRISKVEQILPDESIQGLSFRRDVGKIYISFNQTLQPAENIEVKVFYSGNPRVAPYAPWDGGFSWAQTPTGAHWIATTCQGDGADLWWPVKDHVSDKPDSVDLHITVPMPLVVASNGRLQKVESLDNNRRTYHWHVSTPISAYNIALNIAPYQTIEDTFTSVAGDKFPIVFYVLPEDYEKGKVLFEEIKAHLQFFEKYFGPYPFRADKYGVAQTPHLGMEHQTIIAYGANFSNTSMTGVDWGFDALHQHELAHEWWGNLITNADWKDMWLHEGFGTYMQALYVEELSGKAAYLKYMRNARFFGNSLPIAPRSTKSGKSIYKAPIYNKGAWVLHALRGVINNDEIFFKILRRMAYPDPNMEKIKSGKQIRFVHTNDFLNICEQYSQLDLEAFFEVYLRQPKLPTLFSKVENNKVYLRLESPVEGGFSIPVQVQLGEKTIRQVVNQELTTIEFEAGIQPVVDPNNWLLCAVKVLE